MLYQYQNLRSHSHSTEQSGQEEKTRKEQTEQSQVLLPQDHSLRENNYCIDLKMLKEISYYTALNTLYPSISITARFLGIIILGNRSLSAAALIAVYQDLITSPGCSMLGVACRVVSNAYGAKEITPTLAIAKIRQTRKSGIVLALILSPFAITSALCSREILKVLQQPEELLDSTEEYFIAFSWGIPALFLIQHLQQIAFGVTDIKAPNVLMSFDNITNTLLEYFLINERKMGMAGVGYAQSITNWLDVIFFSLYLKYNSRYRDYEFDLWSEFSEVRAVLKELFSLGIPLLIQTCGESLIFLGYSAFVGKISSNALSAFQIATQIFLFVNIPIFGFNQAAVILVGRETGANRIQNAKKIGTACIVLGGGVSLLICTIMSGFPRRLMSSLIEVENPENEQVVMMTKSIFIVMGVSQICQSFRTIAGGTIEGAFKDTSLAMKSGLAILGSTLGLAYLLAFPGNLGLMGVCISLGLGRLLWGGFLVGYWFKKIKNWLLPTPPRTLSIESVVDVSVIEPSAALVLEMPTTLGAHRSTIEIVGNPTHSSATTLKNLDEIIAGERADDRGSLSSAHPGDSTVKELPLSSSDDLHDRVPLLTFSSASTTLKRGHPAATTTLLTDSPTRINRKKICILM